MQQSACSPRWLADPSDSPFHTYPTMEIPHAFLQKGRLQVANAFNSWARLSVAAFHADRAAETASTAKRRKTLRASFFALYRNAASRRRGRQALFALDVRVRLRRLARGWGAVKAAAAAATAAKRAGAFLVSAEKRIDAAEARAMQGRVAIRARAHRTARRLLGVARGRVAMEAFVAWRGIVREGRGARLGAAALAARYESMLGWGCQRCLTDCFCVDWSLVGVVLTGFLVNSSSFPTRYSLQIPVRCG